MQLFRQKLVYWHSVIFLHMLKHIYEPVIPVLCQNGWWNGAYFFGIQAALDFYNVNTHTRLFKGPLFGTTRVSRYQKGKTNLDFTEAKDREWQWHQLGHTQVCTSLQRDNHASTPPFTRERRYGPSRLCVNDDDDDPTIQFLQADSLPVAQPTVSKHYNVLQKNRYLQNWGYFFWNIFRTLLWNSSPWRRPSRVLFT